MSLSIANYSLLQCSFIIICFFSPPTLYLLLCDMYLEADLIMIPHSALCVNICVCVCVCVCVWGGGGGGGVCTLKVDKGYQDVFISFLFGDKQFKPGHLSFSFMEEEPCGKNSWSVFREWKKP